ncbi:hypothetical protein KO465_03720 [Candidatus Micrarchaeota archaeon]|jgi:hypothetical protein|nr:hypothetical protein [Candidatus Micrarchaeota archaeon]
MKLPGVSKFFNVNNELYGEILKIDSKTPDFSLKATRYGKELAKKKRVSSILYIYELFKDLGSEIKILSSTPFTIQLNIAESNFIVFFMKGLFLEIYGLEFEFKTKKTKPLILEGRVKKNKNEFFETVSNEK